MRYTQYFSRLSRFEKAVIQVAADSMMLLLAFFGALIFRFENLNLLDNPQIWTTFIASMLAAILSFQLLGVYRAVVRFLTLQIVIKISQGLALAVGTQYLLSLIFDVDISHSVPIIFAIFALILTVGVRFGAQSIFRSYANSSRQPVIIYGAGSAGRQLVNALSNSGEHTPIAFVDDDPELQQLSIEGLIVNAPTEIARLAVKRDVKVVLLAMPTIDLTRRREIVKMLNVLKLEVKTIPSISDIVSDPSKVSSLKKVKVEDLLGRDPILPIPDLLRKNIVDRVVMVTGAGGSIGSELCRQIIEQKPTTLILFEMSEFALYRIDLDLSKIAIHLIPSPSIVSILGSVNDTQLMENTIKKFKVQTIFHAAAYKHVPLIEENVVAGIRNNVFGTLAIATAAKKLSVENFVLISSDKAVRPTNIMGATKRISEMICQVSATEASQTNFAIVRFGNVLASSGSVIPQFQKQIEEGGPVTVTHRDVVRYFMTVSEAAQLVIQASAMSKGGDVFVLDMGQPIKIADVATAMVQLSGKTPYITDEPTPNEVNCNDIAICFTGLRKGEKLYEELLINENALPTQHPRINTAAEVHLPKDELNLKLQLLSVACENLCISTIIEILSHMELGYSPSSNDEVQERLNVMPLSA